MWRRGREEDHLFFLSESGLPGCTGGRRVGEGGSCICLVKRSDGLFFLPPLSLSSPALERRWELVEEEERKKSGGVVGRARAAMPLSFRPSFRTAETHFSFSTTLFPFLSLEGSKTRPCLSI